MLQRMCVRVALALVGMLVFGSSALADVTLELRPSLQNVVSGELFEVELYGVASPSQPMGRIDAVLNWNLNRAVLVKVKTGGGAGWSVSQLTLGHPLNTDLTDGDGFYQARVNTLCADPGRIPLATSAGTLVTTLVFRAISPSTGASISIVASSGGVVTQVWDDDTLSCAGLTYATTPLGPPVFAIIVACTGAGDCDDGNACTENNCVIDTCEHPLNYDNTADCCDPATGNLTTIDDGIQCTRNLCVVSTGAVTHPPQLPGTACGDPASNACTDPDSCDGGGTCVPNNSADGGVCNHPDSCVLAATCVGGLCEGNSFEADGTPCDDGIACTGRLGFEDSCQGGACTGGATPCTSPSIPLCFSDGQGGFICGNCVDEPDCPDVGCLQRGCSGVTFICVTELADNGFCDDGLFCNGVESCNQTFGSCDDNADPCTDPANSLCNETLGCFECANDADCPDIDLCQPNVCNVVTGQCGPGSPTDCSAFHDECNLGVCNGATGLCDTFPVETVNCPCPVGYTCSQATNKCLPLACDDQVACTLFDRCSAGACMGDDPIPPGGTMDLAFEPQAPPAIAIGQTIDLAVVVSTALSSTNLHILEALINWNPAVVSLSNRVDPCACGACDPIAGCPPGEYSWFFSDLPAGCTAFDPDCFNIDVLDGDAFYVAQTGPGDPPAPVTSGQPLTATVFTFMAVGATAASGTEVLFSECDGTSPSITRVVKGAGNVETGSLFSATVRVNCTNSGQCDSGNTCAVGTCNQATSFCEFAPVVAGTACGNSTPTSSCDQPDACDGAGACGTNPKPGGTSCASDGNDCTDDACDGAGTCDHTIVPLNTACTDDGSDCTSDLCNGTGTCTHPNLVAGMACGNPTPTSDCDQPDTCDGVGICDANPKPFGTGCDDQNGCTINDACDQGICVGNSVPDCGECQIDSDCVPDGAACTDDRCIANQCVFIDVCQDNGVFCDGVEACNLQTGFCGSSGDPCPGVCSEVDGCPCQGPAAESVGPRYLAVRPQPPDSPVPIELLVESPELACLSKFVGILVCGGTRDTCKTDAECNACTGTLRPCLANADCKTCADQITVPCSTDGDCNLGVGCIEIQTCQLSGQLCESAASLDTIDIDDDGVIDGALATLVDDPADAMSLLPTDWVGGASDHCNRSLIACTDDSDCDSGNCLLADGRPSGPPCSVLAQNCAGGEVCERTESCLRAALYIHGEDIIPSELINEVFVAQTYDVSAKCGGSPTAPASAEMRAWGDIAGNNRLVNVTDVAFTLLAIQKRWDAARGLTKVGVDMVKSAGPCFTDPEVISAADLFFVIRAFKRITYESEVLGGSSATGCQMPCP